MMLFTIDNDYPTEVFVAVSVHADDVTLSVSRKPGIELAIELLR